MLDSLFTCLKTERGNILRDALFYTPTTLHKTMAGSHLGDTHFVDKKSPLDLQLL